VFAGHRRPPETVIIPEPAAPSLHHVKGRPQIAVGRPQVDVATLGVCEVTDGQCSDLLDAHGRVLDRRAATVELSSLWDPCWRRRPRVVVPRRVGDDGRVLPSKISHGGSILCIRL